MNNAFARVYDIFHFPKGTVFKDSNQCAPIYQGRICKGLVVASEDVMLL
jgi:hypothetical protein